MNTEDQEFHDNDSTFQLAQNQEIEMVEGGANDTNLAQSAMVGDQSMEQLQNRGTPYDDSSNVISNLSTSPARQLKGESVPVGALLDFSFANLAWQDKGNKRLMCWQTMSSIRNCCFLLLIGVAVLIAFVFPSNMDGTLKSINSSIATVPQDKLSIPLADLALHELMFFEDKTVLHGKLGQSDDAALSKDLCAKFRLAVVETSPKGTTIFLSECLLMLGDSGNDVVLYNNLNKFKAYSFYGDKDVEHFHDLSISEIEQGTKQDLKSIEFNDKNNHWIWIIEDHKTYKDAKISKVVLMRTSDPSKKQELDKTSYAADLVNPFIDDNEVILQVRKAQTLGKDKMTSERVTLMLKKFIYKQYGSDTNLNETETLRVQRQGSYMHLVDIDSDDTKDYNNNVELPLEFDLRETVTEYEIWGLYDYMKDVGSFLAIAFILVLMIQYMIGFVFVTNFVSQFKQLLQRKYQEANYLHQIKKHLKKFDQISQALFDRKDEPEYKEIFDQLELYLQKNYEKMNFKEIEKNYQDMEILDQKLPDIDDVEDMLSAVRFQQPAAQKQMNKRINRIIDDRTYLSLGNIAQRMKDRLSFFGLFMLHDEVELNTAKMKSEMYIQNEKLEFLFKTLAERSERRSTKKRQRSIRKTKKEKVTQQQQEEEEEEE